MLRIFLLLSLSFSYVVGSARAEKEEWKNIGPSGGTIHAIAIDSAHPEIIYAGTDQAGVFKTTDGGRTWGTVNDGLGRYNGIEVYALATDPKDPGVVIAGTGDGLFRSKNQGFTWAEVKRTGHGVRSLAIDPSNSSVIYSGLSGSFGKTNILKSTDHGVTWTDLVRVPETEPVVTIAIDPTNPKTIYAGGLRTIVKSIDGGSSWISCVSGLNFPDSGYSSAFQIAIDPSNSSTVYAATTQGVFKSTDSGANWTPINQGLPSPSTTARTNQSPPGPNVTALAIDQFKASMIFAGVSQKGLYKSTNGGASWEATSTGLGNATIFAFGLCPSDKNLLCVGTRNDGVFKSEDGGARWSAINAGLQAGRIDNIAIDPSDSRVIYAGSHDQRIFKTVDRGLSWTSVESSSVSRISINPKNTRNLFAATFTGILASEDAGASWADISSDLPCRFAYAVAVDPSNPMTIFAGLSAYGNSNSPFNGVFKSTNGGVSWKFAGGDFEGMAAEVLAIDPSDPKTIYAGSLRFLFKSTDGGASWSKIHKNLELGRITAIAIDPSDPKTIYVGTERTLLKSTNGGVDWTQVRISSNDSIASIVIDPVATRVIYVGTSRTVFRSTDAGKSWSWSPEGLPSIRITTLAIDPSDHETVYAATAGASIFKRRFPSSRQHDAAQTPALATSVPSPNAADVTDSSVVDSRPVPLNHAIPRYTDEARRKKVNGVVRLRILIDADGSVQQMEVLEGLPYGLTKEAMSAVSTLKFKPAMKNGSPVPYWMVITVEFNTQ